MSEKALLGFARDRRQNHRLKHIHQEEIEINGR
jgi:hypothetical protein